jgi:nucleoside-diphosphate-sugar epimerase
MSTLVTTSPICVTGGSGFLASWVVKMLLEKGFTVHATTRKMKKALFLKELEGSENLKIFDGCDFSVPTSFDKAIEGCYAVIHCASPFFNAGATRENLVVPAVEGTEMVLNACTKYNIQRVTLTASSACVIVDNQQQQQQQHHSPTNLVYRYQKQIFLILAQLVLASRLSFTRSCFKISDRRFPEDLLKLFSLFC